MSLPSAVREIRVVVRLHQRPPMRGERGWWVHADHTADGQLQEVLDQACRSDLTHDGLGWESDRDWDRTARDTYRDHETGQERTLVPVTLTLEVVGGL